MTEVDPPILEFVTDESENALFYHEETGEDCTVESLVEASEEYTYRSNA